MSGPRVLYCKGRQKRKGGKGTKMREEQKRRENWIGNKWEKRNESGGWGVCDLGPLTGVLESLTVPIQSQFEFFSITCRVKTPTVL